MCGTKAPPVSLTVVERKRGTFGSGLWPNLVVVTKLPLFGTLSRFELEFLESAADQTLTFPQILHTAGWMRAKIFQNEDLSGNGHISAARTS